MVFTVHFISFSFIHKWASNKYFLTCMATELQMIHVHVSSNEYWVIFYNSDGDCYIFQMETLLLQADPKKCWTCSFNLRLHTRNVRIAQDWVSVLWEWRAGIQRGKGKSLCRQSQHRGVERKKLSCINPNPIFLSVYSSWFH